MFATGRNGLEERWESLLGWMGGSSEKRESERGREKGRGEKKGTKSIRTLPGFFGFFIK